jgi:hypothetical protein
MSKIDLSLTQVRMPASIKWTLQEGFPKNSLENAVQAGSLDGLAWQLQILPPTPAESSIKNFVRASRHYYGLCTMYYPDTDSSMGSADAEITPGRFGRRAVR